MSEKQQAVTIATSSTSPVIIEGGQVVIDLTDSDQRVITLKSGGHPADQVTVETSQPQKQPALRPVRSEQMRLKLIAARDELRRELADPNRTYAPVGKRKRSRI